MPNKNKVFSGIAGTASKKKIRKPMDDITYMRQFENGVLKDRKDDVLKILQMNEVVISCAKIIQLTGLTKSKVSRITKYLRLTGHTIISSHYGIKLAQTEEEIDGSIKSMELRIRAMEKGLMRLKKAKLAFV